MEDVSRDAGDIATRLELNLVRTIGDALVAHVEGCILGQIDVRSLCRGVGVLGRVFRTDLKVDTVLRGVLLCIVAMFQVSSAVTFMFVTWMP